MSGSGGSVRQRTDGRWEGRYTSEGTRRSVFAKTKAEAQVALRKALTDADNGIKPVNQRVTVATYLAEWLEASVEPRCRPRTTESYADTVKLYIAPSIGHIQLAKLQPSHIDRMLATLAARGDLSTTTQRYAYSILRIALGRALKTGRVVRNVATLVDPPQRARPEMHPLTAEEARSFLGFIAGDRHAALYTLAIATGCRQGELLALRWSDVDLDAGTLTVRHTLQCGTRELTEPKTERSRRTLRLGAGTVSTLKTHKAKQAVERLAAGSKWQDKDYVFATSIGTALDGGNVTRALQAALAAADLPRQRFHDLRHAYATLMIEDGVDLAIVSRSLGHASLGTTANIYMDFTEAMGADAAARMDGILAARTG